VLSGLGLVVEVDDICEHSCPLGLSKCHFMPTLRPLYYNKFPSPDSQSLLVVTSNLDVIPYDLQCQFVVRFTTKFCITFFCVLQPAAVQMYPLPLLPQITFFDQLQFWSSRWDGYIQCNTSTWCTTDAKMEGNVARPLWISGLFHWNGILEWKTGKA